MQDWRDRIVVVLLMGVFVLLSFGLFGHRPRQVEPGSPEYAEFIEGRTASCIKERIRADMERNRGHLPAEPTPADRDAICRFIAREFDLVVQDARPFRYGR
jgi:hypothetical protein